MFPSLLQRLRLVRLRFAGVEIACPRWLGACIAARPQLDPQRRGAIAFGTGAWLEHGVVLHAFGGAIRAGRDVFIGPHSVIYGHGGVEIGDACLIASHCRILSSNHTLAPFGTDIRSQPDVLQPTRLGRDVWLGAGVTVLGGVTIGDGCAWARARSSRVTCPPARSAGAAPPKSGATARVHLVPSIPEQPMPSAATARPPDNSIGLLRLLLAASVLWGHSWYLAGRSAEEPISRWLLGGGEAVATFAVKAFFVLSGYLVMQSGQRLASTRRFLWHRLLRIYPGFWACLLVTALILPAATWAFRPSEAAHWSSMLDYLSANWLRFYEQTRIDGLFTQSPPMDDLNGSLWTLLYELGCYAVLAGIGWLGLPRPKSKLLWVLGLGLGALYCHDVLRPNGAWFFKSEGRLLSAWFLTGALAANLPTAQLRRWLDWRGAFAATLAYLAACRFGGLALVGPFAITALVLSLAWLVPIRDFEARVGGDYSYGVYIYAYPVQQCLLSAGVLRYGMASYLALVVVITLLLAFASWHLVEKRALAWKSLGRAPLKPVPSPILAPQAA